MDIQGTHGVVTGTSPGHPIVTPATLPDAMHVDTMALFSKPPGGDGTWTH